MGNRIFKTYNCTLPYINPDACKTCGNGLSDISTSNINKDFTDFVNDNFWDLLEDEKPEKEWSEPTEKDLDERSVNNLDVYFESLLKRIMDYENQVKIPTTKVTKYTIEVSHRDKCPVCNSKHSPEIQSILILNKSQTVISHSECEKCGIGYEVRYKKINND